MLRRLGANGGFVLLAPGCDKAPIGIHCSRKTDAILRRSCQAPIKTHRVFFVDRDGDIPPVFLSACFFRGGRGQRWEGGTERDVDTLLNQCCLPHPTPAYVVQQQPLANSPFLAVRSGEYASCFRQKNKNGNLLTIATGKGDPDFCRRPHPFQAVSKW